MDKIESSNCFYFLNSKFFFLNLWIETQNYVLNADASLKN